MDSYLRTPTNTHRQTSTEAGPCPQAGVHGLSTNNIPRLNHMAIDEVACQGYATTTVKILQWCCGTGEQYANQGYPSNTPPSLEAAYISIVFGDDSEQNVSMMFKVFCD